jgi:hypothetical protein
VTSDLYSGPVNKSNPPNTLESLKPCSGQYSLSKDLRLNRWLMVATATYVVSLFLSKRHPEWSASVRAALSLAPLVPGLLYIRSHMQFIRGLDELQRRIQLEAWLFAFVGTALVGTAVATMNEAGVPLGGLGHGLGIGPAYLTAFVLWLFGTGLANHRYK